jgi:hypothetical protein
VAGDGCVRGMQGSKVRSSGSLVPSFALMKRGGAISPRHQSTVLDTTFPCCESESTRNESSHKHLKPALHKHIFSTAKCRFRETKITGSHGSVVRQPRASSRSPTHAASAPPGRTLKGHIIYTAVERDSEQYFPLRQQCEVRFETAHVRIRCVG